MTGVGAGVRESLATILALEWFLSGMDSLVLLQVMFEFESFTTMAAFKLSQVWAICMIGHVSLKFVESWKLFAAQTAGLKIIQISIL